MFYWSSKLSRFDIPSSLTSIGWRAFQETNLTSVVLPESVKSIGKYAFNDTALTLYIEREQGDIPSGWDKDWNYTYAANPIEIVWGASPSDVQG